MVDTQFAGETRIHPADYKPEEKPQRPPVDEKSDRAAFAPKMAEDTPKKSNGALFIRVGMVAVLLAAGSAAYTTAQNSDAPALSDVAKQAAKEDMYTPVRAAIPGAPAAEPPAVAPIEPAPPPAPEANMPNIAAPPVQ